MCGCNTIQFRILFPLSHDGIPLDAVLAQMNVFYASPVGMRCTDKNIMFACINSETAAVAVYVKPKHHFSVDSTTNLCISVMCFKTHQNASTVHYRGVLLGQRAAILITASTSMQAHNWTRQVRRTRHFLYWMSSISPFTDSSMQPIGRVHGRRTKTSSRFGALCTRILAIRSCAPLPRSSSRISLSENRKDVKTTNPHRK